MSDDYDDRLKQVQERNDFILRNDPNQRVRQTALAVLQRLGHISYEEAMEYLEDRG
jgi:hypothetical protein